MALDKISLKNAIKAAFKEQTKKKDNPEAALNDLADKLASALDTFVKSGEVNVTVANGIPVSTTGTAAAQTGVTTSTGTGTGTIN